LTVIAFLWRPNQNNQKYAFIPLLENDEDDENEFIASYSDTKLRTNKSNQSNHFTPEAEIDETLKWVEDNLPTNLLLGDSDDEEISKFEISKMQ
jgi:hypothetical protein